MNVFSVIKTKLPIFKQVISKMDSGPKFLTIFHGSYSIEIKIEWNRKFCFPRRKKTLILYNNGIQSYNWYKGKSKTNSDVFAYDELEFIDERPVIYITKGHKFKIHHGESKDKYTSFNNLPYDEVKQLD